MKNYTNKTAPACRHARNVLPLVLFVLVLLATSARAQVTNHALHLDGGGNFANLGTVNPDNNFSTGLTFEAWVKWDAFNTWSRILDLSNGTSSDNLILANEGNSNRLRFEVYRDGSTEGVTIPDNLNAGQWYHVAVTQTQTGLTTIYLDGKAVISSFVHTPENVVRSQCYLGRSAWNGDGYLAASVDELRIWNVARTETEIRQNMLKTLPGTVTGLVASYSFNENSGTTLTNSATDGGAGFAYLQDDENARIASPIQETANALGLDGIDDYVSIGSPLTAGSSYTKEAWVYLTKSPALPQNILSSHTAPFWIDGTLRAGNTGATFQLADPMPFPMHTWVHVAVSYDAASHTMRLYRDGALVNAGNIYDTYPEEEMLIGAWHTGLSNEAFLGGLIDELRIWNVARTGADIAASMNSELDAAAEPSLVSRFSFNLGIPGGDNNGLTTIACQKSMANAMLMNMDLSGPTSNFMQQKTGLVVLPVRLKGFTAQKKSNTALLQWSTAMEQNAARFVIEHSTDGKHWRTLDAVAAAGNSNTVRQYSYVHTPPAKGRNHYRLLLADNDGKSSYSSVNVVSFEETAKAFTVQQTTVTNGQVQVVVHTKMILSLFTQDGKMLWSRDLPAGSHAIPVSNASKGMHYLSGNGLTERIMIQ